MPAASMPRSARSRTGALLDEPVGDAETLDRTPVTPSCSRSSRTAEPKPPAGIFLHRHEAAGLVGRRQDQLTVQGLDEARVDDGSPDTTLREHRRSFKGRIDVLPMARWPGRLLRPLPRRGRWGVPSNPGPTARRSRCRGGSGAPWAISVDGCLQHVLQLVFVLRCHEVISGRWRR